MTARPFLRGLALALSLGMAPLAASAEGVTVFAAASLKDALDAIAADWQSAGNAPVTLSYAGTPALAQQIIAGAPADIFFSASDEWMDEVEAAGLAQPGTRRDLLGNTLVLIAHGAEGAPIALDGALDLPALLGEGRIAMAMVDSVPAGIYGREAMTSLGLWQAAEPLVAQTENVRAALALVAAGEAPLGIVYGSDALASKAAGEATHVAATFPVDSHSPITYPVTLIRNTADARAFLDHLGSDAARAVFEAKGFTVLP